MVGLEHRALVVGGELVEELGYFVVIVGRFLRWGEDGSGSDQDGGDGCRRGVAQAGGEEPGGRPGRRGRAERDPLLHLLEEAVGDRVGGFHGAFFKFEVGHNSEFTRWS